MTSPRSVRHPFANLAPFAAIVAFACTSPSPDACASEQVPDAASFPAVAAMLVQSCGSLDCHGTIARNLRLYGDTALRYALTDVPSTLIPTTPDEVSQDFESLVGLEPEIMTEVVASGGANPERLTFVRKAMGTESHKGGAVIVEGDDRYVCVTSWLNDRS
jgi:hypothetical protein